MNTYRIWERDGHCYAYRWETLGDYWKVSELILRRHGSGAWHLFRDLCDEHLEYILR